MRWGLLAVIGVLALAGCGSAGGEEAAEAGAVSRAAMGARWPLKVPSGVLRCEGQDVIFTAPSGTEYGLNGLALEDGYADPEPIWRYERGMKKYGIRVSMGPLISQGHALC